MYLAYFDDSGSDSKSTIQVVTAVIVHESKFFHLESMAGLAVYDLIGGQDSFSQFDEFKASELYSGHGAFEGMSQELRFDAIRTVLSGVSALGCGVVYGAVDKSKLSKTVYSSANSVDVAFQCCARDVAKWLVPKVETGPSDDANLDRLCLFIADDTGDKKLKQDMRMAFRGMRPRLDPASYDNEPIRVHDSMYFGDSRDSVGLQAADMCGLFIMKHLCDDQLSEGFYEMIKLSGIHTNHDLEP